MTKRGIAFGACVPILLFAGIRHRDAPQGRPSPSVGQSDSLTVRNRFDVVVSYRTSTGATRRVRVSRRQWSIPPGTTLPRSPEPGLLIVQLTSGDVTTTIGRERRQPSGDEFWTVLPSTSMGIEVGKEQATLEVLAVTEP